MNTEPTPHAFRYRPDIDGLRAVAVLVVMLFHAELGFTGGFIGVDVFFVISGFLITSLIWHDLSAGQFTFSNFWLRRARRIIPALVVVSLATLVAGWFLLLPADLKNLGRATLMQSVFLANYYYSNDLNYFAGAVEERPLLHMWSLAVEEQYYLLIPFLLYGIFRLMRGHRLNAVRALLLGAILYSFMVSLKQLEVSPRSTFYLLPSRAWELLLGSFLVFVPYRIHSGIIRIRFLREALAMLGICLIVGAALLYNERTPFPGLAALPPCLGAALLIFANSPQQRNGKGASTAIGSMLSVKPLVWIGLASYSLYLWHWPLLSMQKYLVFVPAAPPYRLGVLLFAAVIAFLSWKFVETAFRTGRFKSPRTVFAFASAGLVVMFVSGRVMSSSQGFPSRFSAEVQTVARARYDRAFINELTPGDIRQGKLVSIGATSPTKTPKVLVWGDSHAMAALPAVDAYLREIGEPGVAATRSATPPVLNRSIRARYAYRHMKVYNDAVLQYIQDSSIRNVILCASWDKYLDDVKELDQALVDTVRKLASLGARPFVVLDPPRQPYDVPRALATSLAFGVSTTNLCAKPGTRIEVGVPLERLTEAIQAAGGRILDLKTSFLDPGGTRYLMQVDGVPLFRDQDHLTTNGAKRVVLPYLRRTLELQ